MRNLGSAGFPSYKYFIELYIEIKKYCNLAEIQLFFTKGIEFLQQTHIF